MSTNDRHTPQHRLTTRHRQPILFMIIRLVHSPLAFFIQLMWLCWRCWASRWKTNSNKAANKLSTCRLSITFSLACVTSLFWSMLARARATADCSWLKATGVLFTSIFWKLHTAPLKQTLTLFLTAKREDVWFHLDLKPSGGCSQSLLQTAQHFVFFFYIYNLRIISIYPISLLCSFTLSMCVHIESPNTTLCSVN